MDRTSGREGMNEQLREDGEALGISLEGIETAINEADSIVDAGGFTEEEIEDESAEERSEYETRGTDGLGTSATEYGDEDEDE